MKTKDLFVCSNCQSPDVDAKYWVGLNTGEVHESAGLRDDEDYFCNTCQEKHIPYLTTVSEDAEVIGYQVVGEEGSDVEGQIHPDMVGSFAVYDIKWAQERIEKGKWRILTIWKDDIEEPTLMYEDNTPNF